MPIARAGADEYLLVGRGGRIENRGSAVQTFLLPGSIHVVVPAAKQEAAFEFTQETHDGIPLRFKGIVVYRVTDPIAAAQQFDFSDGGPRSIGTLLAHVSLGELRHAVSHMTMTECIEERKTTLSTIVRTSLDTTIGRAADGSSAWGITIDVAQVAQVFIVDPGLRAQLEAEVRNEIRLRSDRSAIATDEAKALAERDSRERVEEGRLASEREDLRREEVLETARLERERRLASERLETERHALAVDLERVQAAMAAEQGRVRAETPSRLLRTVSEREVLGEELETRRLEHEVRNVEVETELLLPRAQQAMRSEILPLEQAPDIVRAASGVLEGANLTLYGDEAAVLGRLAPILDLLSDAVARAVAPSACGTSGS
jgi:hypothetical protein